MSLAEYKLHDLKDSTPITWFKCAYCGKHQWRRTSKIKNSNLIFCDNKCSLLYRHNKKNKKVSNKEINNYYNKYYKDINLVVNNFISKNALQYIDKNEILRECKYCIYKCILNSKNKNLNRIYLLTFIKKHLFGYYKKFIKSNLILTIDNTDILNNKLLSIENNIDNFIDNKTTINKIISNFEKYPKCFQVTFLVEAGVEKNNIQKYYGLTGKNINNNVYYGKKYCKENLEGLNAFK